MKTIAGNNALIQLQDNGSGLHLWGATFALLLAALFYGVNPAFAQHQGQRVALVIGNSAYEKVPLRNPVNDARDMATRLRSLGFVVVERSNLRMREIGSTLRDFRSRLTPGSVALVFYAGHGVQSRGENFLPTVDAQIEGEEDLPNQSMAIRQIMDVLAEAKTRLNLVFLDACRDNPYSRNFRTASRGLSRENAPSGTLISFATRPGGVANDGPGRNGLYTSALLKAMEEVNQPIEQVLKSVVASVKADSKNQQEPWMEGSIEGEFCFAGCSTPISSQREDKFWDDTKAVGNREAFEAYLTAYPIGRYASLAKANITRLTAASGGAAAQAAPTASSTVAPTSAAPVTTLLPAQPQTAVGRPVQPAIANVQSCAPQGKDYPVASLKALATGTTRVKFTVDAAGKVSASEVVRPAGSTREHRLLDRVALQKLSECAFKPGADESGRPIGGSFEVEYVWKIDGRPARDSHPYFINLTNCEPTEQQIPEVVLAAKASGTTQLSVVVGPAGTPTRVRVTRSAGTAPYHKEIDSVATKAVSACKFLPSLAGRVLAIDYTWSTAEPWQRGFGLWQSQMDELAKLSK